MQKLPNTTEEKYESSGIFDFSGQPKLILDYQTVNVSGPA